MLVYKPFSYITWKLKLPGYASPQLWSVAVHWSHIYIQKINYNDDKDKDNNHNDANDNYKTRSNNQKIHQGKKLTTIMMVNTANLSSILLLLSP